MTTILSLKKDIISYLHNNGYNYVQLNDLDIDSVHKFFFQGIKTDNLSSNVLLYYAVYYEINNDLDNCMKYYLMAIEKNNSVAMYNLGSYYYHLSDFDNIMKYY